MAARAKPLRSSAGRNSRKRPPLDADHVARAQAFSRRVMHGTSKIVGGEHLQTRLTPPPGRSTGPSARSSTTTWNTPCRSSSPAGATPPTLTSCHEPLHR